jgi:hypothetical protein
MPVLVKYSSQKAASAAPSSKGKPEAAAAHVACSMNDFRALLIAFFSWW